MLKRLATALLAAGACLAACERRDPPPLAGESSGPKSAFEMRALVVGAPCLRATQAANRQQLKDIDHGALIAACTKVLDDLQELRATAEPLAPHDRNIFNFVMATTDTSLSFAYGLADGNDGRMCER